MNRLYVAVVTMAVIAAADMASTLWWLSRGMMTEANPIMAWLLARGTWLAVSVKALTVVAWAAGLLSRSAVAPRQCVIAAWATVAGYVLLWCGGVIWLS